MPDASGTPTSPDNIPTYNTAVDPPSGKGFNTAMAQIQTIITELKAGTLPSGKIAANAALTGLVPTANLGTGTANSTTFLRGDQTYAAPPGSKTTVSLLSGGPPGSPSDGDIWIATAVDANGTRWQFQYNAGSASAFKWEFIGGPRYGTTIATSEATTSTSPVDLATVGPNVTLARSGDYWVEFGFTVGGNSGANAAGELFVGGTDLGIGVQGQAVNGSGGVFPYWTVRSVLGRSAGDVMKLKYSVSNGVSTTYSTRFIFVTPIRVA